MAQLPQEFLTRMQDMLGDEFDAFLTSYDAPRTAGLRVNTKKCRMIWKSSCRLLKIFRNGLNKKIVTKFLFDFFQINQYNNS